MKRVEVCSLSLPLSSSLCGALPPSLLSSPPLSSQHQSVRTPSSLFLSHPLRALLPAGQTFFQSGRISSTSCKKLNKFTWKFNQEFFCFVFFLVCRTHLGPRYGPQNACGCVRAGPGRTDGGLSPTPTPLTAGFTLRSSSPKRKRRFIPRPEETRGEWTYCSHG